ncbi:MAG: hypothetical protein CME65_11385 [Halobacteriovoraceae bacterium]|nr:hypothetical protein [Halobacteriovoraceae bacterium]|tara:strand:- start:5252 stop:5674 length:423 start_codon:yes stop_codon:yes gene_type:complete
MSHRLIFSLLLALFYGLIFFRVEHWPFTDWGVYAYKYHPEKVFVFDLSLKDSEPKLAANLLENLGQSPVTFNAMITRSYLKKDEEEIDKHILSLLEEMKNWQKQLAPDAEVQLILKSFDGVDEGKIRIKREVYKSYKLFQ